MTLTPDTSPHSLDDIANWIAHTPREWSEAATETTHNAIIDTVACMLAGAHEPVVDKLLGLVRQWGAGPASVVGHPDQLPAPWAALVNGASAHALDFDDNFDPAKAHASAVLIPALLAVGEQEDASLGDLIDAYIVGLQVMGHVGQAVNPFHRARGWHATATLGAIGAAATAARLLKLPAEQAGHAVSMSTSRAGGFMSQFGTDTKPLHAGFAASGGVQSALMARAGLTAGRETLDGPASLRLLMVGPDVDERAAQMAGTAEHGQTTHFLAGRIAAPLHVEAYGLKIKRFPNCGSVHRALDGLLELREQHGLTADMVDHVLVRAPAAHLRNLMYETPATPSEARFSLEYNLALGLMNGAVSLSDFTPDTISRTDLSALYPIIRKDYVEELESSFPTEVHIHTKDGTHLHTAIKMPVGSKQNPLTRDQLFDKYEDCVTHYAKWSKAKELRTTLEKLSSSQSLRDFCANLRPDISHPNSGAQDAS